MRGGTACPSSWPSSPRRRPCRTPRSARPCPSGPPASRRRKNRGHRHVPASSGGFAAGARTTSRHPRPSTATASPQSRTPRRPRPRPPRCIDARSSSPCLRPLRCVVDYATIRARPATARIVHVHGGFVVHTLTPLTIGELLDRAFADYRRHFVLFAGIAAIPGVFLLAVQLASVFFKPAGSGAVVTAIFWLALVTVALVTTMMAHGATVVAVSQIQLGRETDIGAAFTSIRPRIGELIVLSLNIGVRVMVGTLLLIVPGILLALRYSLAIPVAVLEQCGVSDSLSRSATLTKGHRGRILLIYVLLLIAGMLWPLLSVLVLRVTFSAVQAGQTPVWAQIVLQFGSFINQSLIAPILTIALTLVYYDERVRKEAFDLEHMMRQLDDAVPGAPHTT